MAKIHSQLLEVQAKLKAPKGQENQFGGYKYRSCEDILKAVKPHLKEQGLVLLLSDDIVEIAGRVYVKATAYVTNEEGGSYSTHAFARETDAKKGMDPSQITGAASSYARKYALNGLFGIDDTKDADTYEPEKEKKDVKKTVNFGKPSEPAVETSDVKLPFDIKPEELGTPELDALLALMDKDGISEEQALTAFKGKYSALVNASSEDLTKLINKWQAFVTHIKGGN